jgi:hypothetical protein
VADHVELWENEERNRNTAASDGNIGGESVWFNFRHSPPIICLLTLSLSSACSAPQPLQSVRGHPYSAIEIIEKTAPSTGGVEITQQFRAKVCRDNYGRTRYENIGTPASGGTPDSVKIDDPLIGATYVLFPSGHLANKLEFGHGIPSGLNRREVIASVFHPSQDLGTRIIEGLQVNGARRKTGLIGAPGSVPAEAEKVEEWYSPGLCVVVMRVYESLPSSKRVFRLIEIVRGEPSADLFKVPADYTVVAIPDPNRK